MSVCLQKYGQNSFAELTKPGIREHLYELSAQPDSAVFIVVVVHSLPVGQPTAVQQTYSCLQCFGLVQNQFAT